MSDCRLCHAPLTEVLVDLGVQPLANAYVRPDRLHEPEPFYPLVPQVCQECFLVQLPELATREQIFTDYAYFSSYSPSWLAHSHAFAVASAERLGLGPRSLVVEVGSNDGYLLRPFADAGIPALGYEPAENVAAVARERGLDTRTEFFGRATAEAVAGRADLLVVNNVLAHVPDLHDFVGGLRVALAPEGTLSIEFPHLLTMLREAQFDTIYHEHYSYFSLATAQRALSAHDLEVVDVEEIPTHGGSLRVHAQHAGAGVVAPSVGLLLQRERDHGLQSLDAYRQFADDVLSCKRSLLEFLLDARAAGKRVVAYGAPAKASTLLNHCGVGADLVEFTVDRSPHKQGCRLPGTRIPILAPQRIDETKPDYVLVLAWNLRAEILDQLAHIRGWGGRFAFPRRKVEVVA